MSATNHLRQSLLLLLPVLAGLGLFIFASQLFNFAGERTRFDELALGKETQIYRATYSGMPVHCDIIPDGKKCLDGWKQRGEKPAILWLGNSQLHAINQMKANDVNGVQVLYDKLAASGGELLAFSQPNASLEEHYVLFEWLLPRLAIKTLILPVVFDDTRESRMRVGIASALSDPFVVKELSRMEIGRDILARRKAGSDGDLAGLKGTPQKAVEAAVTNWLKERWPLWQARAEMRGEFLIELISLRNWAFGINAQSKRKIIPGRYRKNMAALEAILKTCVEKKIEVLLYVIPLRNDVPPPYVISEYTKFKKDVANMAVSYGAVYANLENLVPGNLWGSKDSTNLSGDVELDFMHFQAGGHRLLANALFDLLHSNHFLSE